MCYRFCCWIFLHEDQTNVMLFYRKQKTKCLGSRARRSCQSQSVSVLMICVHCTPYRWRYALHSEITACLIPSGGINRMWMVDGWMDGGWMDEMNEIDQGHTCYYCTCVCASPAKRQRQRQCQCQRTIPPNLRQFGTGMLLKRDRK